MAANAMKKWLHHQMLMSICTSYRPFCIAREARNTASSAKRTRDEVVQFFSGTVFFFNEECLDSTEGAI